MKNQNQIEQENGLTSKLALVGILTQCFVFLRLIQLSVLASLSVKSEKT